MKVKKHGLGWYIGTTLAMVEGVEVTISFEIMDNARYHEGSRGWTLVSDYRGSALHEDCELYDTLRDAKKCIQGTVWKRYDSYYAMTGRY